MLDADVRRTMGQASQIFQLVVEGPVQRRTREERREQTREWLNELDSTLHKEDEVVMNLLVMTLAQKYEPSELFRENMGVPLSLVISLFDLAWNAGRLYEEERRSSITIMKEKGTNTQDKENNS